MNLISNFLQLYTNSLQSKQKQHPAFGAFPLFMKIIHGSSSMKTIKNTFEKRVVKLVVPLF